MNASISTLLEHKGSSVFSVPANATVAAAVAEMNRQKIGCVLIMDGARLTGVFTERDVLTRVVGAGVDPKTTLVSRVMTANVNTITREATIEEVMTMFAEKRCRHLPVVEDGQLLGLISIGDISRWVAEAHHAECVQLKQYIAGGYPS
ncbi:MAG TPA: CBS domain-containing protein [Opitutaceae bacterium]|jgi:CBS domain-containing protein|nr:CBS domain-containing protein [Opitutaceae bacterium]